MVQSVNVRIGDIFCAEIEGWFKRFFQFVGKDVENLNSAVIRVFERTYPMEEQPDVAQILDDRTEFYTHTFVQPGLKARAWYKVGHAKETGEKELRHVLFANFIDRELLSERKLDAHIEGIWRCWHFGEEAKEYAKPPLKKEEQLEGGAVYSYVYILPRLKYGIFPGYEPIDKFVRRRPRPDAQIFVRREYPSEGYVRYLHFIGSSAERQIDVFTDKVLRFQKESETESLLEEKKTNPILEVQIEIVKHIFEVKVEERKAAELRAENAAKKQKILAILARKQDAELENKSAEELEKLIAEL